VLLQNGTSKNRHTELDSVSHNTPNMRLRVKPAMTRLGF